MRSSLQVKSSSGVLPRSMSLIASAWKETLASEELVLVGRAPSAYCPLRVLLLEVVGEAVDLLSLSSSISLKADPMEVVDSVLAHRPMCCVG